VRHNGYSRLALTSPAACALQEAKRGRVTSDLGEDLAEIKADLVADYAKLDVLISTVHRNIEGAGVFTTTGRRRAAVDLLLSLIDRRLKLATVLGTERKTRSVSPAEHVRSLVVARAAAGPSGAAVAVEATQPDPMVEQPAISPTSGQGTTP
jgi:hypothetical protein